jgi:hypothetical protein
MYHKSDKTNKTREEKNGEILFALAYTEINNSLHAIFFSIQKIKSLYKRMKKKTTISK